MRMKTKIETNAVTKMNMGLENERMTKLPPLDGPQRDVTGPSSPGKSPLNGKCFAETRQPNPLAVKPNKSPSRQIKVKKCII